MKHLHIILPFLILSLAACQKDTVAESDELQKPQLYYGGGFLTKSQQEMTNKVNDFGFGLFNNLHDNKDVFLSPFSASLALSMLTTGADGNTEKELLKTLGFDGRTTKDLDEYYRLMLDRFQSADQTVKATAANSIWPDKNLIVNDSYLADCLKYFDSEINTVDYGNAKTLTQINDWCSKHTNGKIPKMLDRLPDGPMTLINAVYFNAKWAFKFSQGKKEPMHAKVRTRYYENDILAMAELPYGNGAFVMDVIIPRNGAKMQTVRAALNSDNWSSLLKSEEIADVKVRMDEFEMEWGKSIRETLLAMGIKDAFDPMKADFSPMSPSALYVDDVIHKTYVKVNKEGTEAAAVTVVEMKYTSAMPSNKVIREIDFTAGDEFIFIIRDRGTDTILFIGQHV